MKKGFVQTAVAAAAAFERSLGSRAPLTAISNYHMAPESFSLPDAATPSVQIPSPHVVEGREKDEDWEERRARY